MSAARLRGRPWSAVEAEAPPRGAAGAMRHFLQSGAVYWAAMLLAGSFNLVFNLVAARALGPDAYSITASLIALINILLIGSTAVTRTATALVAATDAPGVSAWILRRGTWTTVVVGVLLMVVLGVLARPLAAFLHLTHPLWIWLVGAAMVPALAGGITTGVLQGMRAFATSGAVNLGGALLKLAALVLLVDVGMGVTGATLATLCEVTVIWLAGLVILYRLLRDVPGAVPAHVGATRSLFTLPAALTVARLVFFNLDVLVARHYLSATQAGLFAALAITGRTIAYGTGALPPVVYPYLVRYRHEHSLTVKYLLLCLVATAVTGAGAIAVLVVAPTVVVHVLFGAQYASIAPYVAWYGLAFLLYALTYVLLHYLLAIESGWVWVYAVGGGLAEVAAMTVFHRGIGMLTGVEVVFFGLLFLLTAIQTVRGLLRGRRVPVTA